MSANLPKIAVSVGDINGVGIEIALKSHEEISKICKPVYFINQDLLKEASKLLNLPIPSDFEIAQCGESFSIKPGIVSKKSGKFSFLSFENAILSTQNGSTDAVVTLPINKEAWKKAGLPYVGHTDVLSKHFKKDAIMMLGCDELFVALFSDHVPLKKVSKMIKANELAMFLINLYNSTKFENVGVLGFNPHAGDNGAIGGKEEKQISKAINLANKILKKEIFKGPLVPDAAFNPLSLKSCNRLVAMYHDSGLAPLKALYFDKSINVSLNLPIIRTSVDHGTAYDIAYKGVADTRSFKEAVKFAIKLLNRG
ncbi:4-hydroxy-L-threonine phosphate dehydrogenase, NAD-dependent [Campylobacter iguaniorum]|uniref:4-hydroxythreonine-4-phosphate dehydrogenase n=1 Tax=Campylobacter iguaniorum TaxID=1244531 RepID=A0A076FA11_9BACT|nr:4-hydroxythreonine-4-phosphate dehydrogenase [Campylobacter iguaniorum]AII14796.1 4-hydroxy-L-threonine phosphate dehydrogenase, NAD-dependent [Campylobacter iguaniorum]ALV24531.1 4-hydroxy-L-threonine phosphate dehydrogenase, NAD-dependent [Campylobacter iguaniorum]